MKTLGLVSASLLAAGVLLSACQAAATVHPPGMATAPSSPHPTAKASAGSTAAAGATPRLEVAAGRPCGYRVARPFYDHVMWIWMENESLASIIGAPDAPYATLLARRCGLATDYYAITHPSLPNYLAARGGTTAGVSDDGEPSVHPIAGASIFSQVSAHGLTWRAYAESMPTPCDTVTSGLYAARHNPAVYYIALRAACDQDDVAMGSISGGALHRALYAGMLANFVFVTPNICDDAHSCPVSHGDEWLSAFLSMVFASPTYRLGHTAVFVVWDEGNLTNQVPAIVAAPSVPSATRSAVGFDHYSLLRTAEQLLGLPALLNSAKAHSMVTAFGL
ncbi:MAG: alkaline phosphatase family protein [Acidimicrobiales bacterium]